MQNELRNETAESQQHEHESALESDGLQWHSNALYQSDDDPLSHARRASAQLKSSKKGGLFHSNSDKYKAVDKGLDDILKLLVTAFSGDNNSDRKTQQRLQLAYGTLIDSCQRYNTSISFFTKKKSRRQAQTENGRERQGIVDSIEEMAKKDLAALMPYFDKMPGLPPQERAKSVQEALRIARTTSLTLKGNWENQKHYGGVISDLIRVDAGGFEGTGKSGFFKKSEYYERDSVKSKKQKALEALANLSEKIPISKEDYNLILDHLSQLPDKSITLVQSCAGKLKALPRYSSNKSFHTFVDAFYTSCCALDTMNDYMKTMVELDSSTTRVNFADVNVASSRVANLLGMGHLITQSERATLQDESGKTVEGFLMQKAEGTEAESVAKSIGRTEYAQLKAQNGKVRGRDMHALKDKMTGSFQKSLADLQVLDNIFGQVDRHDQNYLVQQNEAGQLTGVTGIDNDFGFGSVSIGEKYSTTSGTGHASAEKNQHLFYAANSDGELTIPHMSAELADNISKVTFSQLQYALIDTLPASGIQALWKRIQQMQTAIRNERTNNPNGKRILRDDEWNADTLEDFMGSANYVSRFVNLGTDAGGFDLESNVPKKMAAAKAAWEHAAKIGKMDTLENTIAFLKPMLPTAQFKYLVDSGELEEQYVPGVGVPFEMFDQSDLIHSTSYTETQFLFLLRFNFPEFFKDI